MPRTLVVLLCTLAWLAPAAAKPVAIPVEPVAVEPAASAIDQLLRGLDTDVPEELSEAVAAIERTPTSPELADVLFAAARACEDRLHDPPRALALYERILRELPDAGVAIAAERRAEQLQGAREHAREAKAFAELVADADTLAPAEVERRADELASAAWPGALDAALWLADWLCRTRRFAEADARYAALAARAPDTEQGQLARRNAAGCAIDAGAWERAEELARALPVADGADAAVRADLLDAAETGRRRQRLYVAAWIAAVLAFAGLAASFGEAIVRGRERRLPSWQPPIEVLYIAPVAAIVIAAAFAVDSTIAPAVVRISAGGLVLAWLSGSTLDLLRTRDRAVRARALVHVAVCVVGVLAIGYIALVRDGLLELFSETVRYGPGA